MAGDSSGILSQSVTFRTFSESSEKMELLLSALLYSNESLAVDLIDAALSHWELPAVAGDWNHLKIDPSMVTATCKLKRRVLEGSRVGGEV